MGIFKGSLASPGQTRGPSTTSGFLVGVGVGDTMVVGTEG